MAYSTKEFFNDTNDRPGRSKLLDQVAFGMALKSQLLDISGNMVYVERPEREYFISGNEYTGSRGLKVSRFFFKQTKDIPVLLFELYCLRRNFPCP